jgi:hypothetical protein
MVLIALTGSTHALIMTMIAELLALLQGHRQQAMLLVLLLIP